MPKCHKFTTLVLNMSIINNNNIFQLIAMETGVLSSSAPPPFLSSFGHRISTSSGETTETCLLFRRISVLLQCFNAVLLHDCLPALDCADWVSYLFVHFFHFFLKPIGNIPTKDIKNNNMKKKRSERRKHCTPAVVRWSQKSSPNCRSRGPGRPKFNQLEMVTTFTYDRCTQFRVIIW